MKPQRTPESIQIETKYLKVFSAINNVKAAATDLPVFVQKLTPIEEILTAKEVTIAFGGYCKSGKSSTLNMLLDRTILPTGDKPVTGMPCLIRNASIDSALLVSKNGSARSIDCTQSSLTQETQLLLDGRRRAEVNDLDCLQLDLKGVPIPTECVWIDTPGIDDTSEMNARAWDAALKADMLVWILNSHHPLAEVEVNFLMRYVSEKGADQVLFLLNCFLRSDTDDAWRSIEKELIPHIRLKVNDLQAQLGASPLRMLPFSATMTNSPTSQRNLNVIRNELMEINSKFNPLIYSSRVFRVKRAVVDLETYWDTEWSNYQKIFEQIESDKRQAKQLNTEYKSLLDLRFQENSNQITTYVQQFASQITDQNLKRDRTYTNQLEAAIADIWRNTSLNLINDVRTIGFRYGIVTSKIEQAIKEKSEIKLDGDIKIPEESSSRKWIGMVIGFIVGLLGMGVGSIPGAIVGFLIGYALDSSAMTKVREAIKVSIQETGKNVISGLYQWKDEYESLVTNFGNGDEQRNIDKVNVGNNLKHHFTTFLQSLV